MADVLTSIVKPLVDIRYCICYFLVTTAWLHDSNQNKCETKQDSTFIGIDLAITMLPYWFRFAQCLHKFYYTRLKAHLLNATKYFLSLMIPVTSTIAHMNHNSDPAYYLFIAVSIIGATYSYTWDLYMDWGLLRSNKPGHRFLRDTIMYPAWCYYVAAVIDLFLRFAWIISLLPMAVLHELWGEYFQVFLADILEWFRRSVWAIFRVEN